MSDSSSVESMGDYMIIRISPPSSPPSGATNYSRDDELKEKGLKSNEKLEIPDQEPEQELKQQAPLPEVSNNASLSLTKKPKPKPKPKSKGLVTMGLLEEEQEELEEA